MLLLLKRVRRWRTDRADAHGRSNETGRTQRRRRPADTRSIRIVRLSGRR